MEILEADNARALIGTNDDISVIMAAVFAIEALAPNDDSDARRGITRVATAFRSYLAQKEAELLSL